MWGELEDEGMKKMNLNFMSEEFKQRGTKHQFCFLLYEADQKHQTTVTASTGACHSQIVLLSVFTLFRISQLATSEQHWVALRKQNHCNVSLSLALIR